MSEPEHPFTVVTYNVGPVKVKDHEVTADLERLQKFADVILLQEVGDRAGALAKTHARVIGGDGDGRGRTGLIIRPGLEVQDQGHWFCAPKTKVGPAGAGPSSIGPKWISWVKVIEPDSGRAVNLGSTHLVPSVTQRFPYPGRTARRNMFDHHIESILGWFKDREGEGITIVGGDFNATANYYGLQPLRDAGLVGITTPSHGHRAIDWQWRRDQDKIEVADAQGLHGYHSDHRPVMVRYLLSERPTSVHGQ